MIVRDGNEKITFYDITVDFEFRIESTDKVKLPLSTKGKGTCVEE